MDNFVCVCGGIIWHGAILILKEYVEDHVTRGLKDTYDKIQQLSG